MTPGIFRVVADRSGWPITYLKSAIDPILLTEVRDHAIKFASLEGALSCMRKLQSILEDRDDMILHIEDVNGHPVDICRCLLWQ